MTSLVYVFINISTQNNFHPAKNSIAFNFFSTKKRTKVIYFLRIHKWRERTWRIHTWWNKSARRWRYSCGDRSTPRINPPSLYSLPRCTDTVATCSGRRWTLWSVSLFQMDSADAPSVFLSLSPYKQRQIHLEWKITTLYI